MTLLATDRAAALVGMFRGMTPLVVGDRLIGAWAAKRKKELGIA